MSAQELSADSLNLDELTSLSLDELLRIKVTTGTSIPTEILKTPSNITVIDNKTLQTYGFISLAEVLYAVAGVDVLQTNLDRNVVTMRGILQNYYSNKVLFMINSVPVWQGVYGNFNIDRINVNDVQRIEILRGPASVVYGTNAYSGAINVILKQSKKNKAFLCLRMGLPDIKEVSSNVSIVNNNWMFYVSGSLMYEQKQKYDRKFAPDLYVNGSDTVAFPDTIVSFQEEYKNSSFIFNAVSENHQVMFNAFQYGYIYPGVNISLATGGRDWFNDRGSLFAYKYRHEFSDKLKIQSLVSHDYFFRDYNYVPDKSKSIRIETNRASASINTIYELNKKWRFESGLESQNSFKYKHILYDKLADEEIRQNMNAPKSVGEMSFYLQPTLSVGKFENTVGTRYTQNFIVGRNVSNRLTSVYKLNKDQTIKLVYGEAFRSPNLLELFFDHPTVVGNENLKPERCKSLELIYQLSYKRFYMQVGTIHTQYKDLIRRVGNSPSTYINVEDFSGHNMEFEIKYTDHLKYSFYINYSHAESGHNYFFEDIVNVIMLEPKQEDDQAAALNYDLIPRHIVSLGGNRKIKKFSFNVFFNCYSSVQANSTNIPAQFQLNASVGYKQLIYVKNWRVSHRLSLYNITDSQMLIPEYIRNRPGITSIATTGYGRSIFYSFSIYL